jgi:hypothetical protein
MGFGLDIVASPQSRFRFARQDQLSSTTSIRLNFRMARNPSSIDAKRGDHFLLADLSLLIARPD